MNITYRNRYMFIHEKTIFIMYPNNVSLKRNKDT